MSASCSQTKYSKENNTDKSEARKYDNTFIAIFFYLQAVLYCPLEHRKPLFYKQKFALFSFTVYDAAKKEGNCFAWDDSNKNRRRNEAATCLQKFIQNLSPTYKYLILYSDCCPGQNTNAVVACIQFQTSCSHKIGVHRSKIS
jgi:hypothetical protein